MAIHDPAPGKVVLPSAPKDYDRENENQTRSLIVRALAQNTGGGNISGTEEYQDRLINTTAPLTGGGDLSADRTLAVSAATTTAKGVVELATDGESAASVVVQGNDARMSNARTPTAHAFVSTTGHTVSGLTPGDFLKATGTTTYAFTAHGLTAADVGAIGGSGTTNYVAKFTAGGTIGNSLIQDNGSGVAVGTPFTYARLAINGLVGGSSTSYGIIVQPIFRSNVTSNAVVCLTGVVTDVAAFTVVSAIGWNVVDAVLGSGSAITTLYGLKIDSQTKGSTNYAIYTGAGLVYFGDHVDLASGKVYKVNTTQVVGAQGATVADATGGTVQDAEARTAINTLLARLRTHGLIAT